MIKVSILGATVEAPRFHHTLRLADTDATEIGQHFFTNVVLTTEKEVKVS